ncbi:hypothetical protein NDI76_09670 [Halogeometricum sp. S1BR25-6]|uniref:DUF7999 domain-containing protein n=1 Tax=Halogeometricum salsisoli TaxID=2950536 RepID=A0ABU2GDY9_9EURY|nr:hypothetical protein [Halogeometricum sp. S1BR25-6]MDS0299013.1 hypothetical protein [Halogeometricum sp. S1BR25-6]
MWSHTTNPSGAETTTARIEWPMNDHSAMTVRVEASNEVRQLVEYESEAVRRTLSRLPAGATVPLKMESLGSRGNAWRVTELVGVDHTRRRVTSNREDVRRADEERGERERRVKV